MDCGVVRWRTVGVRCNGSTVRLTGGTDSASSEAAVLRQLVTAVMVCVGCAVVWCDVGAVRCDGVVVQLCVTCSAVVVV